MYGIHRRRNDDQIHLNLSNTHRRITLLHCNTAANILSKDRSQEQFPNGCISQNASKPISSLFQCCHVFFLSWQLAAKQWRQTHIGGACSHLSHKPALFLLFVLCDQCSGDKTVTKGKPRAVSHCFLFFKFTFFNHSKHFSLCQKILSCHRGWDVWAELIRASISLNMHSPIWGSQRMTTSWEKDKYI